MLNEKELEKKLNELVDGEIEINDVLGYVYQTMCEEVLSSQSAVSPQSAEDAAGELGKIIENHRAKRLITCEESCWCWDVEKVAMKLEHSANARETRFWQAALFREKKIQEDSASRLKLEDYAKGLEKRLGEIAEKMRYHKSQCWGQTLPPILENVLELAQGEK